VRAAHRPRAGRASPLATTGYRSHPWSRVRRRRSGTVGRGTCARIACENAGSDR
jgi:hypothetical protein